MSGSVIAGRTMGGNWIEGSRPILLAVKMPRMTQMMMRGTRSCGARNKVWIV